MPTYFLALVAVFLISSVESSYDCRNQGTDTCLNSGKCNFLGKCDCRPEFEGYNCGYYCPTNVTKPACTVQCQNGGTCYHHDPSSCYCPYEYVGDRCQLQRTGVICKRDEMMVVAYRDYAFEGELYVRNNKVACKLVHHMFVDGMVKYVRPIKYNSRHCKPQKTVDPTTGDVTYSLEIISVYKFGEFGSTDRVFKISCDFKGGRRGVATDATGSTHLVKAMVVDPKTEKPVQALKENEKIILHFTPQITKDIKGVMVHYLEIYSRNGTEFKSLKIIDKGCPLSSVPSTIGPVKSYSEMEKDIYVGKVELKTFILIPGEPLLLNYRLHVCPGICPWPQCPPPTSAPAV